MIEYFALTDKGQVRKVNQDFYAVNKDKPQFFVLCDGMGGHKSGDVASKSAGDSIKKYIQMHHSFDMNKDKAEKLLSEANDYANKLVFARSQRNAELSGMGTTSDICYIDFDRLYIGHVGDGRVYLYRDGELTQLTKDHTLMEELLKNGTITKEEAKTHPNRHMITRAVGTEENIKTDFISEKLSDGDIILMCSDGVYNMLSDAMIKKIFLPDGDVKRICSKLVEKSKENGGLDNITAIVIRYTDNKEERA